MAHIAVTVDELSDPGLPQHLAFFADPRCFALTGNPELKPLKEDLPFSGHAPGIGLPSLILGIHELGVYRKRNVHIARSLEMNDTSL